MEKRAINLDNEIFIIPFRYKNLKDLQELHEKNNLLNEELLTMQDLPRCGFVAYMGKSCVAAGFLRRIEPYYGLFDTFVTNPFMGKIVRHEALNKIVDALIQEAKDLELKGLMAFTKDIGILERAKAVGFQVADRTMLTKQV